LVKILYSFKKVFFVFITYFLTVHTAILIF